MVRETIWPQSAPKVDPVNVVQILLQDGEAGLKLFLLLLYNIMDTRPLLEPACSFLNIRSTAWETLCRGCGPCFTGRGQEEDAPPVVTRGLWVFWWSSHYSRLEDFLSLLSRWSWRMGGNVLMWWMGLLWRVVPRGCHVLHFVMLSHVCDLWLWDDCADVAIALCFLNFWFVVCWSSWRSSVYGASCSVSSFVICPCWSYLSTDCGELVSSTCASLLCSLLAAVCQSDCSPLLCSLLPVSG